MSVYYDRSSTPLKSAHNSHCMSSTAKKFFSLRIGNNNSKSSYYNRRNSTAFSPRREKLNSPPKTQRNPNSGKVDKLMGLTKLGIKKQMNKMTTLRRASMSTTDDYFDEKPNQKESDIPTTSAFFAIKKYGKPNIHISTSDERLTLEDFNHIDFGSVGIPDICLVSIHLLYGE
jgi:hypothetical protein